MRSDKPPDSLIGESARAAGSHYRRTFGRAVAVVYTGGTIAQGLKLIFAFGWEYMPYWVDWALIVLGTYGGVGLVRFAGQIMWRGTWEKVVHGLIAAHLLVSVAVHAWVVAIGSHEFFTIFPYEYSYFAVAYEPGEENLASMEKDQHKPFTESKLVNKFLGNFGELEAAVQEETGVSEWWRWLVFFGLLLLCLELYLGWRFSA